MEKALKDILVKQAKEKGMCLPNFRPLLQSENTQQLIDLYRRTIDWALENQYPTLDILRRFFSDCEGYGLFVGRTFHGETLRDHVSYIFHDCRGRINVEMNTQARIIPMLYFANGCDMEVVCRQDNYKPLRIPLYIFGENSVKAKDGDRAVYGRYEMELM